MLKRITRKVGVSLQAGLFHDTGALGEVAPIDNKGVSMSRSGEAGSAFQWVWIFLVGLGLVVAAALA